MISIHYLLLFIVLVQSASLYKLFALDDHQLDLNNDLSSSDLDDEYNQALHMKQNGYNNDDDLADRNNLMSWLSGMRQEKALEKRSGFSNIFRSQKALPQRRNSRPHWNPLVAAYRRCGELSTRDERESCFKDAVQMLFVHKLRK